MKESDSKCKKNHAYHQDIYTYTSIDGMWVKCSDCDKILEIKTVSNFTPVEFIMMDIK